MKTIAALFATITVLGWLLSAWLLMLLVGVVHAEWIPQLPTIGFRAALLVAPLLLCVSGASGLRVNVRRD